MKATVSSKIKNLNKTTDRDGTCRVVSSKIAKPPGTEIEVHNKCSGVVPREAVPQDKFLNALHLPGSLSELTLLLGKGVAVT